MNLLSTCAVLLAYFSTGHSYSKYGRSCKDIGCLSNEVCVMESDPCSYYQRQNECGSYPTCKKQTNAGPRTCQGYVCPPTKICRMDGATPKCVDDASKTGFVHYDTSANNNQPQDNAGGAPNPVNRGETTPRPNVGYQGPAGPGYQGGRVGSGYPGQPASGYPAQQGGYPQQQYPGYNNNNNNNGYGQYPNQPPNQNNYPNYPHYPNYPNQQQGGGYPNNYNYNPYGQQNRYNGQHNAGAPAGGGFLDSITGALKKYGLFCIIAISCHRMWI